METLFHNQFDMPDFEQDSPSSPADFLQEIIELQRACYERKIAYVNVEIGGNGIIQVSFTNDIDVQEYLSIDEYHISPKNWIEINRRECRYDDAGKLESIVKLLQEWLL